MWLKGRHQLKFGYRLVDRRPSPFIHDNTRSAINFGTSFVNNPLTNSGGTGLAEVLLGYFNSASRGFLLEKPEFRVVEQATFVQDDFKVNNRLTVNAGLRYEIFSPPTEKNNRIANFDYQNYRHRLRRRKRHQPQREQEDAVRQPRAAPRHHLQAHDRMPRRSCAPASGSPISRALRGRQPQSPQRAVRDLAERQARNQSARLLARADDRRSLPADRPGQADGRRRSSSPPIRACRATATRTRPPYAEQWHLGIDRQLFSTLLLELEYAGSAAKHLVLCYNPNEVQPGPGSEASRRLLQPIAGVNNMLQCDPRNRSTYHAGTLKLQKRFSNGLQFLVSYTYGKSLDYGSSAASGGGAVGNGQTITNMDAWHGPSGFDVRHRAVISYVYELPFGTGRRWMTRVGRPFCRASSAAGSCRGSRR